QIPKLYRAQKKLAAPSNPFWPVIHIDDELHDSWRFWLPETPLLKQSIDHEITGFVVRAEESKRFPAKCKRYFSNC
ncbi:MAG: hypothetical protein WCP99_24320, partial [Burkholderiales bacterium]